jgi:hypothetical protein
VLTAVGPLPRQATTVARAVVACLGRGPTAVSTTHRLQLTPSAFSYLLQDWDQALAMRLAVAAGLAAARRLTALRTTRPTTDVTRTPTSSGRPPSR